MSTNQKDNEEEVDLGSLFVIIGKGFSNFFNFIGNIFKGIFHLIISILIFLKTNIVKIGIAALIGGVLGVFLEVKKVTSYEAELLLAPNFQSTRQLHNNVNYYNDLVKQKDTASLQKIFNLDKNVAASLKEFKIEPLKIDRDIINAYDDLILSVDTLATKGYEYEDFKNSFTKFDYRLHKVTVRAEKNDVLTN